MSRRKYWKDRIPVLVINGVGMVLLSVFLLLVGNSPDSVALILLVWILSLFVYLSVLCWRRKRKLDQLLELAKNLDERYLLAEMLPRTAGAEEEVYIRLFKMASKSMLVPRAYLPNSASKRGISHGTEAYRREWASSCSAR